MADPILKRWWEVYPKNTQAGNEEQALFKALARNKQHAWRTVDSIAKEAGLTKTRTEEIISKYYVMGLILQSSKNPELFGYWERIKMDGTKKKKKSILKQDQDQRFKALKKAKP